MVSNETMYLKLQNAYNWNQNTGSVVGATMAIIRLQVENHLKGLKMLNYEYTRHWGKTMWNTFKTLTEDEDFL
jgi:hypothetical protein